VEEQQPPEEALLKLRERARQERELQEPGRPAALTAPYPVRAPVSCCIHPEAANLPTTKCSTNQKRPACVLAPGWWVLSLKKRA
jgi:hypothetical protein